MSDVELRTAQDFLHQPGISVLPEAQLAIQNGQVHAMHDPTEGGVLTGLAELAAACRLGLHVDGERVPVYPETAAVCRALAIDPLGLIASGALLIGAPSAACEGITASLARRGIAATDIGQIVSPSERVTIELGGVRRPLVPPMRDELARILDEGSGTC